MVETTTIEEKYTKLFDVQGGTDIIYIGKAIAGANTGSPVWQIKKLIYDTNNNVSGIYWASGNTSFDYIYDSRETYPYY